MAKREELIQELVSLICKMDIPHRRKEITQTEDLRWLKRCLPDRNSEHKNFSRVMEILQEVV